jgi:hypothetical protein
MDRPYFASRPKPRRRFLQEAAALAAASAFGIRPAGRAVHAAGPADDLPRIAAVNTVYRFRSHAYHIAGRFIHGYSREGVHHQPPFRLVRMYNHQYPENDLARVICGRHGIELAPTVAEALGPAGGLDVDGVLLIAEHGDYPVNALGQILYPRYELYQQIVAVFRSVGRSVPVFNDKHLSYDHQKAGEMVAASRELGFGLMAGSSLPVTWRRPEIEPDLETPFQEGLVVYGGSIESYFFHGLEALACMLERRRGGETGMASVCCLEGKEVWKAADQGRFSPALLRAALGRSPTNNYGDVRENVVRPVAILIDYRDGTKGTVLNVPEQVSDFTFAGSIAGREEPLSTCFYLPSPPGAKYFDALTFNIEKLFAAGRPPYPVERTLLTSTVLDLAMRSLADDGRRIESPALDVRYQPPADSGFFRGRYTDLE